MDNEQRICITIDLQKLRTVLPVGHVRRRRRVYARPCLKIEYRKERGWDYQIAQSQMKRANSGGCVWHEDFRHENFRWNKADTHAQFHNVKTPRFRFLLRFRCSFTANVRSFVLSFPNFVFVRIRFAFWPAVATSSCTSLLLGKKSLRKHNGTCQRFRVGLSDKSWLPLFEQSQKKRND